MTVSNSALTSYAHVKEGDCVVGFSRKKLYELKDQIETLQKGIRCCVIYGNLPPEARKEQAQLFNDRSSEYQVLIASDAIGMGLNLSIKRIIFSAIEKFDGKEIRYLTSSEVKQIAGRAGRFGTDFEEGKVCSFDSYHSEFLGRMYEKEDEPVETACLSPSQDQLRMLAVMVDYDVSRIISFV